MKKYLLIISLPVISILFLGWGLTTTTGGGAPANSPPPSSLENGLVSFWNLDEESGERVDDAGNNDLTDNNTVLFGVGKIDNAADLESGNDEYLSHADNADLSFSDTDDFTIAAWVYLETDGLTTPVVVKCSELGAETVEYGVYMTPVDGNTANEARMVTGSGAATTMVQSSVTVTDADWFFVCGWFNHTTDSLYIVTNTEINPARTEAVNEPHDGNNVFMIGSFLGETYAELDGRVDLVGLWDRCPISANGYAMVDSIYNGGDGWQP